MSDRQGMFSASINSHAYMSSLYASRFTLSRGQLTAYRLSKQRQCPWDETFHIAQGHLVPDHRRTENLTSSSRSYLTRRYTALHGSSDALWHGSRPPKELADRDLPLDVTLWGVHRTSTV